jgi:adenylate kinase
MQYFEVGAMVRRHIAEGSAFGTTLREYSSKGLLVPDEVIIPEIRNGIAELGKGFWVLDGFPRNTHQIKAYEDIMDDTERTDMLLHLQLHPDPQIAREIAEERMIGRAEYDKSLGKQPRKDDIDPATRAKRLDEARQLDDILGHFHERNKVITVDASQVLEQMLEDVRQACLKQIAYAYEDQSEPLVYRGNFAPHREAM